MSRRLPTPQIIDLFELCVYRGDVAGNENADKVSTFSPLLVLHSAVIFADLLSVMLRCAPSLAAASLCS